MRKTKIRVTSCIVVLAMVFSLLPQGLLSKITFAATAGAFTVEGGTEGTDYSYADGVLTVLTETPLTISNTDRSTAAADRIVIGSGVNANVVLAGVNISASTAFNIPSVASADITLAAGSTNTLTGTSGAGIHVPSGATVTIRCGNHADSSVCTGTDGCGTLSTKGANAALTSRGSEDGYGAAAGIGGNRTYGNTGDAAGTIKIYGGIINAVGGNSARNVMQYVGGGAAGVGGGGGGTYYSRRCNGGSGGNVEINGGYVIASGGSYGIGGGGKGTVGSQGGGGTLLITDGILYSTTTASNGTCNISSNASITNCTIQNSTVNVTGKGTITNSTVKNIVAESFDYEVTGSTLNFKNETALTNKGENSTYNGNVVIEEGAVFSGTVRFNNNVTVNTNVSFKEPLTVGGNLTVNKNMICNQNLSIGGTTTVTEQGSLSIQGDASFSKLATFNDSVTLGGNAMFNNGLTSKVTLDIQGNATFGGQSTISQNMTINGSAEFKKTFDVGENVTLLMGETSYVQNNGTITNNGKIVVNEGSLLDGTGTVDLTGGGTVSGSIGENLVLRCAVTQMWNNATASNTAETIDNKTDYTTTLTPAENYTLPQTVNVTIGGTEAAVGTSYTYSNGTITIPRNMLRGNVELNGTGVYPVTFNVTNTEQLYAAGTAREIEFTPICTVAEAPAKELFTVKYYKVDENNNVLESTTPVANAVSAGVYMYVIQFIEPSDTYGIPRWYEVTDTTIPNFDDYDNIGYMTIKSQASILQPIYFKESVVYVNLNDGEYTNELINNNTIGTISYISSNTDVAEVDNDGKVTLKKPGSVTITATCERQNYTPVTAQYLLDISKKPLIITAVDDSTVYGSPWDGVTDVTYSETPSEGTVEGTISFVTDYEVGNDTGKYEITPTGVTSDIYDIIFVPGTLTVEPKSVTADDITVNANDKTYDGNTDAEITANVNGVNALVIGSFESADYGTDKTVNYTITGLSGYGSENYVLENEISGTTTANITQAPVYVTVPSETTYIYDGEAKSVNAVAISNGVYFYDFEVTYNGVNTEPYVPSEYTIGINITNDNYYLASDVNATMHINNSQQEFFSIEGIQDTITYGDTGIKLQADGVKDGASVEFSIVEGDAISIDSDNNVTTNGVGTVKIQATSILSGYDDQIVTKTINVVPKKLNVVPSAENRDYDGTRDVNASLTLDGVVNEDDVNVEFDTAEVITPDVENNKTVFINGIRLTGSKTDCYELSSTSATTTMSIGQVAITGVDFTAIDKVYDGNTSAEFTINGLEGVIESDKDYVTLSANANFDNANAEANKTVTLSDYRLTGLKSGNYKLDITENSTTTATIEQARVDFTLGTLDYVYDGTAKTVDVSATVNGVEFNDYTVTYDGADSQTDVGSYDVIITLTDSNNYKTDYTTQKLTIVKSDQENLTITGLPGTIDYGAEFKLSTVGGSGDGAITWTSSDNGIATVDENGNVNIIGSGSEVTITATKAATSNYHEQSASVSFTPNSKAVTFTISNLTQIYDGSPKSVTVTPSDTSATYVVTYDSLETAPSATGTYLVTVTANGNYSGTASAILTIKNDTVNVDDYTFTVDDSVYGESYTVTIPELATGLTGNVTYIGTGIVGETDVQPTNAGSYVAKLTISGDNFDTVTIEDTFEIAKATLTAKPNDVTRAYGEQNPTFTIIYTGFVNGEDESVVLIPPVITTEATVSSTVNTYPIYATGGYAENYNFVFENGTLTITEATGGNFIIVGGNNTPYVGDKFNLTALYNNERPNVTWSSDTPEVATVDENGAVEIVDAGTATITATIDDSRYGDNITATFTLNAKYATETQSPIYFNELIVEKYVTDGTFIQTVSGASEGATVTYKSTNEAVATVDSSTGEVTLNGIGSATIIATATKANCADVNATYSLVVTGKKIVVTATDDTVVYGSAWDNVTDVTYSEDVTLDGELTFTTDYTVGNNVGEYTITPSGLTSDKYTIEFVPATLTVTRATLTAKPKDVTRVYGEQNPIFTMEYTGFVNNDDSTAVTVTPTMTTTATVSSPVGNYDIIATGGYAQNYNLVYETGTLTITEATGGNFYIYGGDSNPNVGDKFIITAYYNNEKPSVKWTSSDTAVVTVNENGEVEVVGSGTATITATMDDSRFDSSLTTEFTINATYATETQSPIYFETLNVEKYVTDGTFTQTVSGASEGATVTYKSTNTDVAEVNETTGEVTLKSVGSATIIATATKANCADVNATYSLVVTGKKISVTAENVTLTYGDEFTATGVTYSENVELNGELTFTTSYSAGSGVGEYLVTPAGLTSDIYTIEFVPGTITVEPKTLYASDFVLSAEDKVYDGTETANVTATVVESALVGEDSLNGVVSGYFEDVNAGSGKTISYNISDVSGLGAENYVLDTDVNSGSVSANITPAKVRFFVSEETKRTYDGNVHKVDISAMALGDVFNESNYVVYYTSPEFGTVTEPTEVGEYTVSVELDTNFAEYYNYELEQPTATLTIGLDENSELYITGGTRNVTVDDKFTLHAYYGNQNPTVEWISSDEEVATVNPDTGEVTILKEGYVTITATALAESYGGASASIELEASKRAITLNIPASELVKTYNGETQYINFESAIEGLEVSASYVLQSDESITEPIQAGTYAVSYELVDDRYTASGNLILTINKAKFYVKAKDITKEYGEAPTYELEMVSGNSTATIEEIAEYAVFTCEGEANTANAGTYNIDVALTNDGDINRSFIVSDEKAILTVTPAPLKISVSDVTREYGAENPDLQVSYEGFKNDETVENLTGTITLTYDKSINAETPIGTYADTAIASGVSSNNYDIEFIHGDVTITKALTTATAGTTGSKNIVVNFDKATAGLTEDNFTVTLGNEVITPITVTPNEDNTVYTISGDFKSYNTYNVAIDLTNSPRADTHQMTSTSVTTEPYGLKGDVNIDKDVNYLDAILVLRDRAETIDLTDEEKDLGDMNEDSTLNFNDAILILRSSARSISNS